MKASHTIRPVFDEPNLVSHAGLAPILALAERAGLSSLVAEHSTVATPNRGLKTRTMLAGMLAGADSIDDLDVLRAGSTSRVIGPVRAPSTMGTFLRSFTHGHVLQLAAINRRLLAGLQASIPTFIDPSEPVLVDMDDTIGAVHGYQKQAAAFGYSKVRGLNALAITVSTDHSSPVISEFSLRRGNIRSGDHADWHLARTLAAVDTTAQGREGLVRADSAFCTHGNVSQAQRAGASFSFTIPHWPTVTRAISTITDTAWTPIYPHAIADPDTGELICDAEVAEIPFTAVISRPTAEHVASRLVVRRVKRLSTHTTAGQETLFDSYRYHAFITNSGYSTVEADVRHRQHALVEQVFAELKNGPLTHLPSGRFSANAAWLGFAVLAFNLSRAAACRWSCHARMATIHRVLTAVPARIASSGRRRVLHLPQRWPWRGAWRRLWDTATGTSPPPPATI